MSRAATTGGAHGPQSRLDTSLPSLPRTLLEGEAWSKALGEHLGFVLRGVILDRMELWKGRAGAGGQVAGKVRETREQGWWQGQRGVRGGGGSAGQGGGRVGLQGRSKLEGDGVSRMSAGGEEGGREQRAGLALAPRLGAAWNLPREGVI